jgi:hypothetical protein
MVDKRGKAMLFDYASPTGYSNTFVPFRNGIIRDFSAGNYFNALDKLKSVNRNEWLNMIDYFKAAEVMWVDPSYGADEIVKWWIDHTGLELSVVRSLFN